LFKGTSEEPHHSQQVMLTKDHNKWNFETLLDLIEGPLLNPKRVEEAIKLARFMKRLMSFFYPFNHRFSDIDRTKVSALEDPSFLFPIYLLAGKHALGETRVYIADDVVGKP
jgi:hypothetical protein